MRSRLLFIAFLASWAGCRGPGDQVAATVGDHPITHHDAELRDQVISVYAPADKRHLGLEQLIQAYTSAEILRRHGRPITPELLDAEEKRIDSHTLFPEKLARLKAIFGDDHAAYLRDFVLPVLAERVIYYDFFLHDPDIQRESLAKARRLIEEARQTRERFASLAARFGAKPGRFHASKERGIVWDSPEDLDQDGGSPPPAPATDDAESQARARMDRDAAAQTDRETEHWIEQATHVLKPGQVHAEVVDQGENWEVVRYAGKSRKGYDFDAAIIPKLEYGPWLKAEIAQVPVTRR